MEEPKGIPDVDLTPILNQLEQDAKQGIDPAQKPTPQIQPKTPWGTFKSPDDVYKGYQEIQSFTSKVQNENNTLKEQLRQLQEQMELARLAQTPAYYPPQTQAPYQSTGDPNIDQLIEQKVAVREIASVLEEEAAKNVAEFQERYAYAQAVSRQYPQLAQSRAGVKKLFEMGDKLRVENMKRNAGKALESIFGEPLGEEEINRLRTLVKGGNAIPQNKPLNINAYMPETSTSTKTGQNQNLNQNPNFDIEIDEAKNKGDVDGVIAALLNKQMAE